MLGTTTFNQIPGLVQTNGTLQIASPPGMLIPVRDIQARIVALKIRLDDPCEGTRYLYLSSTNCGGPGPGSPAHAPIGIPALCDVVRITEGELKADVATRLSGIPTISFPGVTSWRTVVPVLHDLRVRTVRVAFDADAGQNKHIARSLRECVQELQLQGFTVQLELWSIDAGKSIDDVLVTGAKPEVLGADEMRAAVRDIAAAAGLDGESVPDNPNEAIDDPHRLARLSPPTPWRS